MESIPEILESLLLPLRGEGLEEDKNSKKARHSSGQVIRLLLDGKRTAQGYRRAEVFIGPTRTEQAYIAAVVALVWDKIEQERASKATLVSEHMRSLNAEEGTPDDLSRAIKNDARLEWARNRDFLDSFFDTSKVYYLEKLLEYFRPEISHASKEERIALLERTIGYANEYLEALRRLTNFLQYGEPGAYEGLATKQVTRAAKQVRAAELRELMRTEQGTPLPYRKIGELLGEKPTPGQTEPHLSRGYDARISRRVKAGRGILKQALGEEGYREHMEEKRAEIEHWKTLSEDEQREILLAENFDIHPGDAYRIIEAGA